MHSSMDRRPHPSQGKLCTKQRPCRVGLRWAAADGAVASPARRRRNRTFRHGGTEREERTLEGPMPPCPASLGQFRFAAFLRAGKLAGSLGRASSAETDAIALTSTHGGGTFRRRGRGRAISRRPAPPAQYWYRRCGGSAR